MVEQSGVAHRMKRLMRPLPLNSKPHHHYPRSVLLIFEKKVICPKFYYLTQTGRYEEGSNNFELVQMKELEVILNINMNGANSTTLKI